MPAWQSPSTLPPGADLGDARMLLPARDPGEDAVLYVVDDVDPNDGALFLCDAHHGHAGWCPRADALRMALAVQLADGGGAA